MRQRRNVDNKGDFMKKCLIRQPRLASHEFPPCHLSRSCRCHYTLKRSVVFFTARVCALQPHYHFTKTSARLVSAVTLSRDEASKCKYKQRRPSHRVIEAFYVHPHCGKIFLSFYSSFVACFYSFDMKLTKCLVKKYFCKKKDRLCR